MRLLGSTFVMLFRIAAISAVLAAAVMGVMLAVNAIAFSQGQAGVKATLQRAIEDGSIHRARPFSPVALLTGRSGGAPLFAHDCLIWTTLIAPGMDAWALTLRTIRIEWAKQDVDPRSLANPDCQAVLQTLMPNASAAAQPQSIAYDRYIIGQRGFAQLLLSRLSPAASAVVVQAIVYGAFILAFVLAWRRRAAAVAVMCATFLLFYGLSYYGGMLFFAPMDLTHALFIIAALFVPPGTATATARVVLGALYGAFIAQFEILTGGVPVALAVIALLTGASAPDRQAFVRSAVTIVAAFCIAFVCSFAIKLAIASSLEGSNLFAHHLPSLLHRLRGDVVRETPPELIGPLERYRDHPLGEIAYLISLYRPWTRIIGWGSSTLGSALVVAGVVTVIATSAWAALSRESKEAFPPALMGCGLALGFLVAWIALFWNHTLVHPFFMVRFLLIPVMSGAVALVAIYATSVQRDALARVSS